MGKAKILLFIILGLSLFFVFSEKAWALDKKIVITELMYDLDGSDDNREWIEILNISDTSLKISDWRFNDGDDGINHKLNLPIGLTDIWITPGEYIILVDNQESFMIDHPDYQGEIIDTTISLGNDNETISLVDDVDNVIDTVNYAKSWGASDNGRTLEKIDPFLENTTSNWQESYILGGTPGEESSKFVLPNYSEEVLNLVNFEHSIIKTVQVSSVVDGDTIKVSGLTGFSPDIRLLGIDCPEVGQTLAGPATTFTNKLLGETIDLVISQNPSEQSDYWGDRTLAVIIFDGKVFNTELLNHGLATYYESANTLIDEEAWKNIADTAKNNFIGVWASSGGRNVILSELLPNPAGDDAQGEWIEIYNPLDREVNLSYFLLDNYLIPFGMTIGPKSWKIFLRSGSDIVLSNDSDLVKLSFPDGILIDQANYINARDNEAWALINDSWVWTDQPTCGSANISSFENIFSQTIGSEKIPKNDTPIQISTGEVESYRDYLVILTGVITKTSGDTFYLDDGSGEIKIYIQESIKIKKPPMHKNDIFRIIGAVNLYRSTWRILPRYNSDIILVKAAKKSSTKNTSKSNKTLTSPLTGSIKSVAAAEDSGASEKPKNSTPLWVQVVEGIIAMCTIVLIFFLIKIFSIKKEKPIGYNFGNDET